MRTMIYSLTRDGSPEIVAELHLQLRPGGSVQGSVWHGDAGLQEQLKPSLPADADDALLEEWHVALLQAAPAAGLAFTHRYEGEVMMADEVIVQE